MARMVNCVKLGREAEGLERQPVPGALGKRIFDNVSNEAWQQWVKHQTMLINENRLNLMDARARKYLAEQMEKHFFGGGADDIGGYVPPQGRPSRPPGERRRRPRRPSFFMHCAPALNVRFPSPFRQCPRGARRGP